MHEHNSWTQIQVQNMGENVLQQLKLFTDTLGAKELEFPYQKGEEGTIQ